MKFKSLTVIALAAGGTLNANAAQQQSLHQYKYQEGGTIQQMTNTRLGSSPERNLRAGLQDAKKRQEEQGDALEDTISSSKTEDADVGLLSNQQVHGPRQLIIPASSCGSAYNNPCTGAGGNGGDYTIGENSCNADRACRLIGRYRNSSVNIGDDSCNDVRACELAAENSSGAIIGAGSCNGQDACREIAAGNGIFASGYASIGDGSCLEERACLYAGNRGKAVIFNEACTAYRSCREAGYFGYAKIYKGSCTAPLSCFRVGYLTNAYTSIGAGSCTAYKACNYASYESRSSITIGSGSCTGDHSCDSIGYARDAVVTIGSDSCTCDNCCKDLPDGSVIGDCQCTTPEDGCGVGLQINRPELACDTEPSSCVGTCMEALSEGSGPAACKEACDEVLVPNCVGKCVSTGRQGQVPEQICTGICGKGS